ncbi:MAG: UDP-N-acetylenolpyruvoylglucosamine reductase [Aquificaceae bacterium]|nr:MAG: UDP-N-acetylenolpyruvoylglucosamine reductase [Aquificaceae bacterium]
MKIKNNHSLKKYNSFGININSRYFTTIKNDANIDELLAWRKQSDQELLLVGGGSNMLFKNDFQGLTAIIETKGIEIVKEDGEYTYVKVAAGENWHQFVRWTVENGYTGLENLSLIPGTVGAAPMQNIGAYGVELADCFDELEAVELTTGNIKTFNKQACQFDYRDSYFKSTAFGEYLIKNITVKLSKNSQWKINYAGLKNSLAGQELNALNISNAVIALRQSKLPDPAIIGNAGSFFKNPIISQAQWENIQQSHPTLSGYPQKNGDIKTSAAWLIDQCGWKGRQQGDAGVYKKHALVLVNYGDASGEDVWSLAENIIASVNKRFGIRLEAEPRLIT